MSAPLDTRLRAEALRGTRRGLPSGIPFRLTAIPSARFRGFWSAYWRHVGQHTCSCLESRYPQPFCGVHTYVVVALRRRVSKATVKWKRYNATSRHYRARLFFEVGVARMGTSEPVRAPPEVSRTRGHRLAKPRQIALSSNLGHSNPRSRARRWVLAARSWDFLSLPNFAPEVFVHARRHVFVVRMRDVFAYRLRVLEAVAANAAMPLVAGEDVRAPLGAFRVVFGIGHFQNPVKRTATTTVTAPTTTAGQS